MIAGSARRALAAALTAATVTLALPAAAQQAPAPGTSVAPPPESQQFDDWRRQCEPPQPNLPDACFIYQKVVVTETGRELLAMAIGYLGEKRIPAAVLTVPLGVYLPHGLVLAVPGVQPIRIVIETCTPQGCRGATALSDEIIAAMRKSDKGKVSLQDARRRNLDLPLSFKGFTKGFGSLKK